MRRNLRKNTKSRRRSSKRRTPKHIKYNRPRRRMHGGADEEPVITDVFDSFKPDRPKKPVTGHFTEVADVIINHAQKVGEQIDKIIPKSVSDRFKSWGRTIRRSLTGKSD